MNMLTEVRSQKSEVRKRKAGFTLMELMVSVAILIMMVGLLFSAFNQTSKAWTQGENRVETFQGARAALDMMGREIAQAMANTNLPFFGNWDSVAFVAPVSDNPNDVVDLMEVVYRLNYKQAGSPDPAGLFNNTNNIPPFKLIRRVSAFSSTNCWNYGTGSSCGGSPFDFYTSRVNWPETGDSTRAAVVAENIVRLAFRFAAFDGSFTVNSQGDYWTSTNASVWTNEILPSGIQPQFPSVTNMYNRTPLGVRIYLDVVDSRGVRALQAIQNALGAAAVNSQAYKDIMTNNVHQFQTYVAIPNRQP
jgi:prepilin-type N-terminal cleavage/methylation domain-containing protein